MSSTDCVDICDLVVSVMCKDCPNYAKCQNAEDEANHDQMEACLVNGVLTNPSDIKFGSWPAEFDPLVSED